MPVRSFHVSVYMWESMGQRDRLVRVAELPLQQRRMLPRRVSPHSCRRSHRLAHGVPEGSKRSHPKNTNNPNIGGCSIEGWNDGQTRCFPEGNSILSHSSHCLLRGRRRWQAHKRGARGKQVRE